MLPTATLGQPFPPKLTCSPELHRPVPSPGMSSSSLSDMEIPGLGRQLQPDLRRTLSALGHRFAGQQGGPSHPPELQLRAWRAFLCRASEYLSVPGHDDSVSSDNTV